MFLRGGKRWAVFISGTGSNLSALLEGRSQFDIGLVVSSTPKAIGILRARRAGVPVYIMKNKSDWEGIETALAEYNIDRVFLAGFMRIVPAVFLTKWQGRILNVHPSLLPAYPGTHSIERAFADQAALGVSVHEVIEEVDGGKILLQRETKRSSDLESTEFFVHVSEHRLIREAAAKWNTVQI